MVNCGDRYKFWVMILKGTCCTHHYLSVPVFYLWDKEMLVKVRAAIWNHRMEVCTSKWKIAGPPAPRSCLTSPRLLMENFT